VKSFFFFLSLFFFSRKKPEKKKLTSSFFLSSSSSNLHLSTSNVAVGVPINLVTYYDDIGEAYSWAVQLPVAAVSLDFLGVPGSAHKNATAALIEEHGFPKGKRLGAGVVDGRSVWADGGSAATFVAALLAKGIDDISVQSSVSLQHLPYDVELEKNLPEHLQGKLAFAAQKVKDIVSAAKEGPTAKAVALTEALAPVANPVADIEKSKFVRELPFDERRESQIKTHAFPTTSIGSFPQTPEIRRARLAFKKGQLSAADYEKEVRRRQENRRRERWRREEGEEKFFFQNFFHSTSHPHQPPLPTTTSNKKNRSTTT